MKMPKASSVSPLRFSRQLLSYSLLLTTVAACSSAPKMAEGISDIRAELNTLQAKNELAILAPAAISQAEEAVRAAEQPVKNEQLSQHLVFVADRKVNIALAQAQSRFAEDQQKVLAKNRDDARLDARTTEANQAHQDARLARADAADARQESDDAQAQLALLNARESERGWVVTLGDVLFDTGKANLKSSTSQHLTNLATFLGKYPQRGAIIEGYTDSVGTEEYNLGLSERRADSVSNFLQAQGVQSSRLSSQGKGESFPVANNESASGRQQNRRVEVIITNAPQAQR
ncbi:MULTISPECIES: OmpA family protein [Shewanella]|jgi:outer membrane protein OmpA-like peptidoglycan-associated protein|uniref:OmpA family protein n=2 Tax=Shewanellaceae TaxID=267890 RepID=UPI000E0300E7|nr:MULTISPECIES: OmpA family protein [Shewanella]MCK7633064.1 OmpA family protein [Shewanella sp. JNE17]MCK7648336.1 OmpA family protein [Shewanella sp. JNE8]MCK7656430.1 OmpA family protein [Shewanella sp. JNE4-2]MDR6964387.1 outer membrane protein OmpA-like peptidoglycan-associated protein [Shewanella putrefaciens]UPO32921.1 OmpA family protein [Shewanella sp. JNE2]